MYENKRKNKPELVWGAYRARGVLRAGAYVKGLATRPN